MFQKKKGMWMKMLAMVTAGVLCFGVLSVNATEERPEGAEPEVEEVIEFPKDDAIKGMEESLDLIAYCVYTYDDKGNEVGDYRYGSDGELYYYTKVMENEAKDGCLTKRVWEERTYATFDRTSVYTYRYMDDLTACYMDKYENGKFDYGRGWVWNADGKQELYVKYDTNRQMESVKCSYYDEEGRLAYSFSGLPDFDGFHADETTVYSYEYGENGIVRGYCRTGDEKVSCYLKEEAEGNVLLEASYTEEEISDLEWFIYDEEGRALWKVTVELDYEEVYSEVDLEHYIYDEEGRCVAAYTYNIIGDITLKDTGLYSDRKRGFSVLYDGREYPYSMEFQDGVTGSTYVKYHGTTGTLWDTNLGEK